MKASIIFRIFCCASVIFIALSVDAFAAPPDAAIPVNSACLSTMIDAWLPAEKFAWQNICENRPAVFPPSSPHVISVGFLRDILSNPVFTRLIPGKRVLIYGAEIGTPAAQGDMSEIVGADVDDLECNDCLIHDLQLTNAKIRLLALRRGEFANLTIVSGSFSEIGLSPQNAGLAILRNVGIDSDLVIGIQGAPIDPSSPQKLTQLEALELIGVHLRALYVTQGATIGTFFMSGSAVDSDLLLMAKRSDDGSGSPIDTVYIDGSKINGTLGIDDVNRQVTISNTTANQVSLPQRRRGRVDIKSFSFSSWLNDLSTTVPYVKSNVSYDTGLLDKIAQSFRQRGDYAAERNIQYLRANGDYEHSTGVPKALLFIRWLIVGYGFYPEVGFIWIAVFVVIGYFVFRSGTLSVGAKPRSWLVYSIDVVVPVIQLDKKHDDIQFVGLRQYLVYAMRILSAFLAFLVFKVLQNAFAGG